IRSDLITPRAARTLSNMGLILPPYAAKRITTIVALRPFLFKSIETRFTMVHDGFERTKRQTESCGTAGRSAAARGYVPTHRRGAPDSLDKRGDPHPAADQWAAPVQLSPGALLGELRLSRCPVFLFDRGAGGYRDRRAGRRDLHHGP